MAKKKENYWYVLVLTSGGPVFVTGVGEGKTAFWKKDEKPKEFSADYAKDMAFGLMVNGYTAFAVCNRFELDNQPYRYDIGEFEWKENEKEVEEDDSNMEV